MHEDQRDPGFPYCAKSPARENTEAEPESASATNGERPMPNVTFDGQSFSVRGRRIWLSAVEFDYALTPAEAWPERLAAAVHAGFNAIVVNCPWSMHEERAGRLRFDG